MLIHCLTEARSVGALRRDPEEHEGEKGEQDTG